MILLKLKTVCLLLIWYKDIKTAQQIGLKKETLDQPSKSVKIVKFGSKFY
jgi:hypothetical protein